jgi:phosphoribosylformylglycinamidine synthase
VAGLADACRALGVPVVGGNVSLYNEGGGGPIYPTPVVGMVGELPDARAAGRLGFAADGDAVAVVAARSWAPAAAGSELAKLRGEPLSPDLPHADLGELRALHAAVRRGVRSGALRSAHDVAEGGLAIALAEACIASGRGADVDLGALEAYADDTGALLFGEGPGAFVVSGDPEALRAFGSAATVIGTVGGEDLRIRAGAEHAGVRVDELARTHAEGLAGRLH